MKVSVFIKSFADYFYNVEWFVIGHSAFDSHKNSLASSYENLKNDSNDFKIPDAYFYRFQLKVLE